MENTPSSVSMQHVSTWALIPASGPGGCRQLLSSGYKVPSFGNLLVFFLKPISRLWSLTRTQSELSNTDITLGKEILFNMEETQAPLEGFFWELKKRVYVKQPAKNVVSFSLSYMY